MKMPFALSLLAAPMLLAACHGSPADRLAANVAGAADARADQFENDAAALRGQAALLANRADAIRDTGEQRADAIRAADQNTAALTPEQRAAIIDNQAPAVR